MNIDKEQATPALSPVNQDFAPIFRRAMQTFRTLLPREREVLHEWAHSYPRVRADADALANALLNACVMAWQSLDGPVSQVVVEAFEKMMDEIVLTPQAETLQGGLPPRRYLRLVISNSRRVPIGPLHLPVPRPLGRLQTPRKPHRLTLPQLEAVISAHKGTVTVSQDAQQGTAFEIYLPTAPRLDRAVVNGSGGALKHILYVDDYPDMRELVSEVLPDAGFMVTCFANATEAYESFVAMDGAYDAVVSDFSLPGLSGVELLTRVKHLQPEVTFVIMSGYVDDALRAAAYAEGAALVISKTSDLDDLCASLRGLLEEDPHTEPGSFTDWASL